MEWLGLLPLLLLVGFAIVMARAQVMSLPHEDPSAKRDALKAEVRRLDTEVHAAEDAYNEAILAWEKRKDAHRKEKLGPAGSVIARSGGFPWDEFANRKPKPPTRFEAYTDCPSCGEWGFHWLRPPLPKPKRGPVRVIDDGAGGTVEIHSFDGMTGPDESMYEVVRTCRVCEKEWGNAP